MNMIKSFNKTISYIETVLDDEIDEKKISQLSGYSFPMFSRIFSILTETTLNEYIRHRKLTQAAIDLRETTDKIIEIAIKYGYESSDSFGNSFKKFHGYTPSEVRNGKQFRVVSRVELILKVRGGRYMNITIQTKPSFKLAGIKDEDIETSLCPEVWKNLFSKYSHETLTKLGNGQSYGMCYDIEGCNRINYMVGYDVTDVDLARKMGIEIVEVPEREYAIVELKGAIPNCIHEGWKYVVEVFFPEQGYVHSGQEDFEVYGEGDMYRQDYKMELWIPIVKA